MAVLTGDPAETFRVEPRSVIPGRQRWDIGFLLGQPSVAELFEAGLKESSGVGEVRANPVTGRLLVLHDKTLSDDEVRQLVRRAAARLSPTGGLAASPPAELVEAAPAPSPRPSQARMVGAVVGGGAAALVLAALVPSPLLRLGAVLGATAIVVWRGWRRSRRARTSAVPDGSTISPLGRILGSHRRRFTRASILSVIAQTLYVTGAVLGGWMIGILVTGPTAVLVGLGLATAASQLCFLAGVILVVLLSYAATSFVGTITWRDLAQTVQHEWRTETYAHVQSGQLRDLEAERSSRLAEVLTADVDQLGRLFAGPASSLLQIGTCGVLVVAAFLVLAPGIAWIAVLPAPIIAWLSFFYEEQVAPANAVSGRTKSLLNSQLINNLEATATIKSFSAGPYEIERIRRLSEAYRQSYHQIDVRTTGYNHTVQVLAISALVGVILIGGLEVLSGVLILPAYNALIALPMMLLLKLPELGVAVEQYQRTVSALGRVLELRRIPVESETTGRALDPATVDGEIVIEGVTFAYPGRSPVLHDLSLRVAAGKTTGIVGVTGAGKTTIAKLLLRLQEVGSGRVLLDGADIRELKLEDLRGAIGFVAQDAFLFDGSIGDNIRYGSFHADMDQVVDAAQVAEADDFVDALPLRYDTMIGERGVTLSGGQKQRLSLARAIVKGAPILVLDEATSAVDNETEAAIQHALVDFARDRTLIIIAHRLSTIRHADWVYVLGEGGTVVEQGTHQHLVERAGVYASLWRLQIGET